MTINLHDKFNLELKKILEYIAQDKLTAAKNFKKELIHRIKEIPEQPYKYRPSIYINDKKVRDMTFKGYTIVYIIRENNIDIITIFNQNIPVFNESNL